MLIPDVNVLFYAYDSTSSDHSAARHWWETTLEAGRPVGLAWVVVLGFLRIMTHRGILGHPMYVKDAVRHVRSWLALPSVEILIPGPRHDEILFDLLLHVGAGGNLTTDAHLAALAIEYQAEIVSTDTDFARFPKLRWFNPLRQARK